MLSLPTTLAGLVLVHSCARTEGATVVGKGEYAARITPLGYPNILPQFQTQADYAGAECTGIVHYNPRNVTTPEWNATAFCDDKLRPRDVCESPMLDLNDGRHVSRLLPYLSFNQFRSEREPGTIETIQLKDDKLSVDITPQYGGKVYGMTDVPSKRGLLHSPAIHQPVQAAKLDAQVDGGIEWNWSPGQLGHWVGSEQDVFAAKLDTRMGPMIRVYEFERFNDTFFQVDMILRNGTLFAHPKVWNPHPHDITGYWWTCVGSKFTTPDKVASECPSSHGNPGTRVLTPAAYDVQNALEKVPWPVQQGAGGRPANESADMSWLSNWATGNDNFVRILSPERPHVTVIDKDIFGPTVGLYHGHPLNGTKFWVGGAGLGSKRWYNWKDAPASPNTHGTSNAEGLEEGGCFFEPQVGHGPTQATGFRFNANSTVEWTEYFKTMDTLADEQDVLYGKDYKAATDKVRDWAASDHGVPTALVDEMDAFFKEVAHMPVTEADVLHVGQPYGALEIMLQQHEAARQGTTVTGLSPSMYFTVAPKFEQELQPWVELLKNGTFSTATLDTIPLSYQVGPRWEALLKDSVTVHGATWLHDYYLGVIAAERLDFVRAVLHLEASLKQRPTAVAYRAMAAILSEPGEERQRTDMYREAWKMVVDDVSFSVRQGPVSESTDRLVYALAGEVAMWMATTSALADRGFDNALDLWEELDAFLAEAHSMEWCTRRGALHCDSDSIAIASLLSFAAKNTTDSCEAALSTLRTFPFVTDNMRGLQLARSPSWAGVQYACNGWGQTCGSHGIWEQCLIVQAEAKAGHPLTPEEEQKVLNDNPPPFWLESANHP